MSAFTDVRLSIIKEYAMACHGVWCVKTIGDRGPKQKKIMNHIKYSS
jgi:hypothetical protein